jgi:Na+-translocating ferredoxin:NAD+ oxidoreductase subunit B
MLERMEFIMAGKNEMENEKCGCGDSGVYERLREVLDKHPVGCPPAPEIIEILEMLFTPEEACAALGLGYIPFDLKTISERAGMPESETEKRLESMADKGLIFARRKDGVVQYSLLPVMPGIFEFPFMKGTKSETMDRLAALWKTYLGKLTAGFGSANMAFSRVLPVGKTIEAVPGVLTFENVDQMIENAKTVGIAHCACRETERNCDAPREACMIFDETCDFLVERGFARYLTKDEMKKKLIEFDEYGLIHQVNNAKNKVTFVCNCCTCCCGLLKSKYKYSNPNVFNTSGFRAECDPATCSQCGVCVESRCHVGALEMADDGPVVNEAACIGCGLCVTGCPTGAMKLVRRETVKAAAETAKDMGMTMLSDKNKLQGFMPYVDPSARPNKN